MSLNALTPFDGPISPRLHSVLIVGCGSIGERHLRCFLNTGRATATACDRDSSRLAHIAATYAVPVTTDAEAALASGRFDAAIICAPAPAHVPLARHALAAGVHVLLEKPLSHSLDGVAELLAESTQSRCQVAVAYIYHVYPFLVAAHAFLAAASFGPVLHATVASGHPFHLLRPAYAQTYFRDRTAGGGAIQDALTHLANWIEHVLGPSDSVVCDCAHLALADVDVEDTVHVQARHGRTLVAYALNLFQSPNESTIQFHNAGGSIKIEFHRQRWGTWPKGADGWTWHEAAVSERDSHFTAQADAFLDQVEGKRGRLCSLQAASQTLRFNLACLASAESDRRVFCGSLSHHE